MSPEIKTNLYFLLHNTNNTEEVKLTLRKISSLFNLIEIPRKNPKSKISGENLSFSHNCRLNLIEGLTICD